MSVSSNSVVCVEGEQTTEFKPKRLLNRPCEPFLYEDQIAVIDTAKSGLPTLLAFQSNEWVELGSVLIPFGFSWATIDGNNVLLPPKGASTARSPLHDIKVVAREGRLHSFVADGSIVAYRQGLELASVSALAPDNVAEPTDLSNLDHWEVVCATSSRIGIRGKDSFKVGLIDGEPVVVTTLSSSPVPFQGTSLLAYRRVAGAWQKTAEQQTPGMTELLAVSDGQKTYVAGQSLVQTLRFHDVTGTEIRPTGTVVKAPVAPIQEPLQRWVRIGQWVYWPGLLVLALGVSWLMTKYRESGYQFGLTTVELASVIRRGIARAIDYFVYVIPSYLLAVSFNLSSQEKVAENMDKMFDAGAGGMMIQLIWIVFGSLLLQLFILVVSSVFQGYWGVTLGKWICGIRTVRTTLRPCGFLRSVLREILILADTLFTITWLPATLLIVFTSCRQRFGDMAADTIVIRKPKTKTV